ncbi:MAG: pyruvate formate lyase family protein, partial [Oscillospiraceae bacterium]|nr:pyruvate formate lyase family protein [Oscillospiraceae bacterium]
MNQGRSRLSGEQVSLEEKDPKTFSSMDEIIEAWRKQFRYLVRHGVISLVTAQEIHKEIGHRPF